MTFVLLQIFPPEANTGAEDYLGIEVIATDESEDELKKFSDDYRERHLAACREFDQWDSDRGNEDWGPDHDEKFEELCEKYDIVSLIADSKFKILESAHYN